MPAIGAARTMTAITPRKANGVIDREGARPACGGALFGSARGGARWRVPGGSSSTGAARDLRFVEAALTPFSPASRPCATRLGPGAAARRHCPARCGVRIMRYATASRDAAGDQREHQRTWSATVAALTAAPAAFALMPGATPMT